MAMPREGVLCGIGPMIAYTTGNFRHSTRMP